MIQINQIMHFPGFHSFPCYTKFPDKIFFSFLSIKVVSFLYFFQNDYLHITQCVALFVWLWLWPWVSRPHLWRWSWPFSWHFQLYFMGNFCQLTFDLVLDTFVPLMCFLNIFLLSLKITKKFYWFYMCSGYNYLATNICLCQ